jgi:hypothetical protein
MIGGIDILLTVAQDVPASDVIIRVVRRHWPDYIFQDVDDPNPPTPRTSHDIPSPTGREFFLYRDLKSALIWEDRGAVPENENTLIYVILGDEADIHDHARSITLVCGCLVGEMKEIIEEITTALEACAERTVEASNH